MVLVREQPVDISPFKSAGVPREELLEHQIKDLAREMRQAEQDKRILGEMLRDFSPFLDLAWLRQYEKCVFGEEEFIQGVDPLDLSGLKVAAVDGGLARQSFMHADFLFLRAVGVLFTFRGNNPPFVKYYPNVGNNFVFSAIQTPLSGRGLEFRSSIERASLEVQLATEILEKCNPVEMMILDGSICIEPLDMFFADKSEIEPQYRSLLEDYAKLYQICQDHNVLLVGCVKDSRSARLTQILGEVLPMLIKRNPRLRQLTTMNYRQFLKLFRDVDLFSRILLPGERSVAFRSSPIEQEPRLSESKTTVKTFLNEMVPIDFYAFYLRPVQFDAPMRVEFFAKDTGEEVTKKADLIARMLLPMSSQHDGFAAPVPQIEADMRARIDPTELDFFINELVREIGLDYSLKFLKKRRDRRPF